MNTQLRVAVIALVVGLVFVVLEMTLDIQTAIAGTFIVGMAAWLLLRERIARRSAAQR